MSKTLSKAKCTDLSNASVWTKQRTCTSQKSNQNQQITQGATEIRHFTASLLAAIHKNLGSSLTCHPYDAPWDFQLVVAVGTVKRHGAQPLFFKNSELWPSQTVLSNSTVTTVVRAHFETTKAQIHPRPGVQYRAIPRFIMSVISIGMSQLKDTCRKHTIGKLNMKSNHQATL